MIQISKSVSDFLRTQSFALVSSVDKNGFPHNSCKDIVKVDPRGQIYLMDAYYGLTGENIKRDCRVSISVVDEHRFMGYCLKGKAGVVRREEISQELIKSWEDNITSRLAKRLLHNLAQDKSRAHHPEASLPEPKQLIVISVEEVVNLTPHYLRKE